MISAMALTVHFRFAAPGRPICFSKTEQMHDLVIGLFINRYEFGLSL